MVNTLDPPPEVIASWPKPNYVDPETRGPALVYISIILSVLGSLMVAARLYSRFFITKAPGLDDALIVLALAFGITLSILVIIGNRVWFSGHHIWDIPQDKYVGHRLNVWIAQWCYVSALSCIKISVLLFYRRLSVTFTRTFMIATWIGIIYNVLYWIGLALYLPMACRPLNAYWDKFDPKWHATHDFQCGSEQISVPTFAALSVVGDFYSALLPMLLIVGLHLPRRQKFGLYGLFAIAFLVVGAGIARTVTAYIVINVDYDFTWVLWEMWIWGVIELYLAILAASAPALKPFLRRFLVEPVNGAVDSSGRRRGAGYVSPYGERVEMKKGCWIRRDIDQDLERIGVAYGGSETIKSREQSFVMEADNKELETRHFELRQSRDKRKMVPTQMWKKSLNNNSAQQTESPTVPPIDATHQQHLQQQKARHVRNFSQPHSHKSSGDTTTGLLPQDDQRPHIVTQIQSGQPSSDPHALGQAHVLHRLSQGSVKTGRIRAQLQLTSSRESSIASPPLSLPRTNSRNTNHPAASPPQYQSQQQYMQHQHKISAQRENLRQPQYVYQAGVGESDGRGSGLDFTFSDDSSEEAILNKSRDQYSHSHQQQQQQQQHQAPWVQARGEMQNQMYIVKKPPLGNGRTDHNRSSSEETLALPRMGSRDDFNEERNSQAQRQRAREVEFEKLQERKKEKEREEDERMRKEKER